MHSCKEHKLTVVGSKLTALNNWKTAELCGESIKNLNKNKVKTELTNCGLGTQGTKQTIAERNIK